MTTVKYLQNFPKMRSTGPLTEEEIEKAEASLGLHFSEEYKDILVNFGAVMVNGHQFNGITRTPGLSVVIATKLARQYPVIAGGLYVIEDLGMYNSMILQNQAGKVFISNGKSVNQIADSIQDFLRKGENQGVSEA